MKWTDDQQRVIDYNEPKNLLVSAAAGSGKTAVMTERILRRTISGDVDISGMLVMTFTEYAAQNMRDRIERSFRQALEENITSNGSNEEQDLIRRQIMMLQQAQISTIHSFCWQIIQTWSGELTDSSDQPILESGFGVLDETRRQMLIEQAVDDVLSIIYSLIAELESSDQINTDYDKHVSAEIPDSEIRTAPFCISGNRISIRTWLQNFSRLFDSMTGKRNDEAFRLALISALNKLRSLADYENWCRLSLNEYASKAADFSASSDYNQFMKMLEELLERAEQAIGDLKQLPLFDHLVSADLSGKEEPRFAKCLLSQLEAVKALREVIDDSSPDKWDRIYAIAVQTDTSYNLARRSDEKREFMQLFNSGVSPLMLFVTGNPSADKLEDYYCEKPLHLFSANMAELELDLTMTHPLLSRFFETVILIDRAYMRLKLEEQAIDFSDFEHFALKLLRVPEVGANYRSRFKEIYLDEYQDTNNIQESIIREIADNNVFMVGDIKQSIYRFRYANPSLFANKADNFEKDPSIGRLLRLNQNFRSVPDIISGVNRFFSAFLTKQSGEINYTDGHELTAGRAADGDARIKILVVNVHETATASAKDLEVREDDGAEKESLAVIREINSLVNNGRFSYGDIVILARTRAICSAYYRQLSLYGIPVTATGEREFLDSQELRFMEALINLLDNMQQDIPLAAVMRSGIVEPAFSEEELMQIRVADQVRLQEDCNVNHFYASVQSYRLNGNDSSLRNRVNCFLKTIELWRDYEQFMSISELIGLIYEESGLLDRVSRMESGAERMRDLELFREWADSFERSRQRGLFSFAAYIRKIREKKLRDTGFDAVISVENAVQIMTVHGSKGLEFPVVFLAGAGQSMNPGIDTHDITVSEHGGITAMAMDPERLEKHMTALHYLHELNTLRAERAESYRLLYVGMTRAEQLLYVTGRVKVDKLKGLESQLKLFNRYRSAGLSVPMPVQISAAASSWLQLILLAACHEQDIDPSCWFEPGGINREHMRQSNRYYDIRWYQSDWLRSEIYPLVPNYSDSTGDNRETKKQEETVLPDECLVKKWSDRLFADYRFENALKYPAKLTVSGLKRLQDQLIASDTLQSEEFAETSQQAFSPPEVQEMTLLLNSPSEHNSDNKLRGAALGSLLHSLFQFVDLASLSEDASVSEITQQIDEMAERRIIHRNHLKQALEWAPALINYAKSELAGEIRQIEQESGKIYREMPFTMTVDPRVVSPGESAAVMDTENKQDITLVQGMIDCWFENQDGITLVDFKSDYLDCDLSEYRAVLKQRYELQLNYYSEAITRATGTRPSRKIIWLIRYGKTIEI